ncbi:MAG: hypothetical protein HY721_17775 [Planctomycetes bacterium]|nr:hypothetical protein [Planctomycetota bacterium]
MPHPESLEPLEALRILTSRSSPKLPPEVPLGEASGFLAEDLSLPASSPRRPGAAGAPVASTNGFALPPGAREGDECAVLGALSPSGALDPWGAPPPGEGERGADPTRPSSGPASGPPAVLRVETGAEVPAAFDRVLPAGSATLLGSGRIRIESLPEAGAGLWPRRRAAAGEPLVIERGTPLGSRLKALLAAAGVKAVRARRPLTVAVAVVGDDLAEGRAPAAGRVADLTGPWLEAHLERLGLEPLALDALGDEPGAVRDAILHVRERAQVLVLAGGGGEGLTDRVFEALRRFEAEVVFQGVALDGSPNVLLARALGVEVLGLGGKPLEAACGFDLFVVPALLSLLGASTTVWDWSRGLWPLEGPLASPSARPPPRAAWASALPCRLEPGPEGPRLRAIEDADPFLPWVPGQEGWAVLQPPKKLQGRGPKGGGEPPGPGRAGGRPPAHAREPPRAWYQPVSGP